MKPLGKVKIKWSPNFAYSIGLIATDGNLSSDGRHVVFTSRDREQVDNFQKGLQINLHVGKKANGMNRNDKKYYVIQIGDVQFYRFLNKIGLTTKKSKTIGEIKIPKKYFFDFLRGHFDGDGSFFSYWDPRWKSSFMFYTAFVSASKLHILWLQQSIYDLLGVKGHITKAANHACYQLKYAKTESLVLLKKMYYSNENLQLTRKYLKIIKTLAIMKKNYARVAKR